MDARKYFCFKAYNQPKEFPATGNHWGRVEEGQRDIFEDLNVYALFLSGQEDGSDIIRIQTTCSPYKNYRLESVI